MISGTHVQSSRALSRHSAFAPPSSPETRKPCSLQISHSHAVRYQNHVVRLPESPLPEDKVSLLQVVLKYSGQSD